MTMVMSREITASRFKAQCLGLLDEVSRTGEPLVVTKHGRPVARVVPAEPQGSLVGTVRYLAGDEGLIRPVEVGWDAQGK